MHRIHTDGFAAASICLLLSVLLCACPAKNNAAQATMSRAGGTAPAAGSAAAELSPQERDFDMAAIKARLEQLCKDEGLPGAGLVIASSRMTGSSVAGVRRKGGPDAILESDRFHIGSNTKAFTSTLAAILVDEGLLSWDTTLADALPAEAATMHSDFQTVTLRELLTHRGGVQAFTAGGEFKGLPQFSGDTRERRLQFARHILSRKPAGSRGEYLYSNAGYAIAAAMLEVAADSDYETLMQERLLGPLGIDALWGWPGRGGSPAPWGHTTGLLGFAPHDPEGDYHLEDYLNPAGGLSLSMQEYGAFLVLQLRALRGVAQDSPFPLEAIRATHEAVGDYSMGWLEREQAGEPMSGHEGSAGTFHIISLLFPQSDLAVAVVTNAGGDKAAQAVQKLALELAEQEMAGD